MKRIIYLFPFILVGCSPKIIYVPTEVVRTETVTVHDTFIDFKLAPSFDSISTFDTLSILERKTAKTTAKISHGVLSHTLEVRDVPIRVEFKYITKEKHDTTTRMIVQPLSKFDQNKLLTYDKLKASEKSKTTTIWKLIGLLALSVFWIFRKPLLKLII